MGFVGWGVEGLWAPPKGDGGGQWHVVQNRLAFDSAASRRVGLDKVLLNGGRGELHFGGVFAQRGHSANHYGVYPGNTPANHPPTEVHMIHSKPHRGCRVQDPGTRGYRRWKTALFALGKIFWWPKGPEKNCPDP